MATGEFTPLGPRISGQQPNMGWGGGGGSENSAAKGRLRVARVVRLGHDEGTDGHREPHSPWVWPSREWLPSQGCREAKGIGQSKCEMRLTLLQHHLIQVRSHSQLLAGRT